MSGGAATVGRGAVAPWRVGGRREAPLVRLVVLLHTCGRTHGKRWHAATVARGGLGKACAAQRGRAQHPLQPTTPRTLPCGASQERPHPHPGASLPCSPAQCRTRCAGPPAACAPRGGWPRWSSHDPLCAVSTSRTPWLPRRSRLRRLRRRRCCCWAVLAACRLSAAGRGVGRRRRQQGGRGRAQRRWRSGGGERRSGGAKPWRGCGPATPSCAPAASSAPPEPASARSARCLQGAAQLL